jgi:carbonic anhydrase
MKLANILVSGLVATLLSATLLAEGHTHWGYTGHEGPESWGTLSPDYSMCKLGSSQSPINIDKAVSVSSTDLEKVGFDYHTASSNVVNNGHTIQVNIEDGSTITVDGIEFTLKQFHFHTPSENQIEGKNFPLEAHFVHASKDGTLAVVALMFDNGVENPFIKKIWESMPKEADKTTPLVISAKEINALLPQNREYYRFNGSLTTPPCSEGVRWLVLKNYATISPAQVEEFLHTMHHKNNRPIQPINARKVMK